MFILIQKAYYDTLIEFRGHLGDRGSFGASLEWWVKYAEHLPSGCVNIAIEHGSIYSGFRVDFPVEHGDLNHN